MTAAVLPSGWRRGNIRHFATMKTGHTPSRSVPAFWDNATIPWFTLADVWQLRAGRRTYLGETANKISELGLANSAAELLPAGTVVLSRTASVGFAGIMPRPMATSQDFWNWVCGDELLPEYLNFQLRSMAPELRGLNMGSTHQTIYKADAAAITIVVPPLPEQRAIADFLDQETARIDTLIDEQQRLVDLLRERRVNTVATALRGLSGRTKLKYRAVVQTGVTLNGEGDPSWPEWPYLRVANVQVGHVDLAEVKTIRLRPEDASMSALRPGDVLMTEGGDIDKLGRGAVWSGEIPAALHQNHVFAVRPDRRLSPKFLVYVLDGPEARAYFMTTARKTTNLASTNKWTLGNLPLACPALEEQQRIVAYLDEQTSKVDTLIAETERFIELARERRSALITAAVTGQIDVRPEVA